MFSVRFVTSKLCILVCVFFKVWRTLLCSDNARLGRSRLYFNLFVLATDKHFLDCFTAWFRAAARFSRSLMYCCRSGWKALSSSSLRLGEVGEASEVVEELVVLLVLLVLLENAVAMDEPLWDGMNSINCRVVSPIEEPPSPKVELMTSRTSLLDAADVKFAPFDMLKKYDNGYQHLRLWRRWGGNCRCPIESKNQRSMLHRQETTLVNVDCKEPWAKAHNLPPVQSPKPVGSQGKTPTPPVPLIPLHPRPILGQHLTRKPPNL